MSFIVEEADPSQAVDVARVEIDCWRDTYPTLLPTDYLLHSLDLDRRALLWRRRLGRRRAERTLVATAADPSSRGGRPHPEEARRAVTRDSGRHEERRPVGFATFGACRLGSLSFGAELFELYILPDFRGLGLGRGLCAAAAERLARGGASSLCVEVLEGNGSRFFYEAIGARLAARRQHPFAGTVLPTLIYGWDDVRALASIAAR